MQSKAKDVIAYIDEAPAERREALNRLRDLCHEIESMLRGTMKSTGPIC